ncbi:hypothetical protein BDN71DRAFT_1512880 [Pleurotus eryngii]|uniref:F-box domain-containing protein n=1 Tax=Pleurotus eryngii TaxID=5323 RepID=A0A9P5ZJH4_PLEER|nr:hypothetical protein BDN71DRAFT_1512880 [Pleurotus eryngii]
MIQQSHQYPSRTAEPPAIALPAGTYTAQILPSSHDINTGISSHSSTPFRPKTLMPSANLPDEMLRHIFICLMTLFASMGGGSGQQPWLIVTQVSYQWRRVVLSCGELWLIVDLSWPKTKKATHVKRAGYHNLDLICSHALHTVTIPSRLYLSLDWVEAIQATFRNHEAVVEMRVKLNPRFLTNLKHLELGMKRTPGPLPRGLFVMNSLHTITMITLTNFIMVESIPLLPNLTVLKLDIVQTTTEVILSSLVADLQLQACWLTWATSPHNQNSTIVLLHPPIATQLHFLDINTSCLAIGEILASFSFPGDCYLGLLYSGSPPESVLSFARSCMADPFKRPLIDELEVVHDSSVPVNAGDVGFWMVPLHFQFRIDELSEFISVMSALPFQQITKLNLIHGDFMCSKAWVGFLYSFDYVTEVRLSYPSDLLAELLIIEGR